MKRFILYSLSFYFVFFFSIQVGAVEYSKRDTVVCIEDSIEHPISLEAGCIRMNNCDSDSVFVSWEHSNAAVTINYNDDSSVVTNEYLVESLDTIISYTIKKCWTNHPNLLVNGGFEKGFDGSFTTDFTQKDVSDGSLGTYFSIVSNVRDYDSTFHSVSGFGGGNFLLINGMEGEKKIWEANTTNNPQLKMERGKDYIFTFYVNRPEEDVEIEVEAPILTVRYQNGGEYIELQDNRIQVEMRRNMWYSIGTISIPQSIGINNNNLSISIISQTEGAYNICIDSIVFKEEDLPYYDTLSIDTFIVRAINCDTCINVYRKWNNVLVVDNTLDRENPYIGYQWYKNGVRIEGATEQFYYDREVDRDLANGNEYYVVMTRSDGTIETTCTRRFVDWHESVKEYNNKKSEGRVEVSRRVHYRGTNLEIVEIFYDDGSSSVRKELGL